MQHPTRQLSGRWRWLMQLCAVLVLGAGSLVPGRAQNITQAEYYLDAPDPGFGAATPITIATPAADLNGLSFSLNVGSLSAGFHRLTVRTKDANNKWSLSTRRTFYYEPLAAAAANINKVEYFIDTDPGFGSGTDVPVTAATDISGIAFSVSVGSLGTGFHTLGVRTRDANGNWSLTTRRTFYFEPVPAAAVAIDKVEYFVDSDPGFGSATNVPVTAAADINGIAFSVNVGSLGTGFHSLGVRTRDANGKWSLTTRRAFYFESVPAAAANINKVEYFIDTDPGFGSGTDVPVTAATDIAGISIAVPVGSLSTGFHTLQVRTRDANGKWSLTTTRAFYYEPLTAAAPNINKVEYYFDTDPGFGSATDVPVGTPAADLAGFAFAADASSLADGSHRFFVRTRDANGKWSLVTNRSFVKNGCASSANVAAGLPGSSYGYGGSTNGLAETAFNTDPAVPNTSNTFYGYNGSLLQADLGSAQTISEVRYKLTPSNTTNFTLLLQTAPSVGGTYTTIDTYTASFNVGTTTLVTRTLASPVSTRVLRIVVQNGAGQYAIISGAGVYYFNCAGPTIVSFTPAGGAGGTSVGITGTNLTGATAVTFNGVAASSFTVNSGTSITAVAPNGGSTGQICVTTPGGTACSAASYVYPPTIATGTVSASTFCAGSFISVPFTTNMASYGAGNQFSFQLSDASGNFTAGSRLYGTLVSSGPNGGVLYDSVAIRSAAGTGYRVRVVASNPSVTGSDNGVNLTINATPYVRVSTNTPVAYGGTIQFNTTAIWPGATYQWSGPNSFSSTQQSPQITGANQAKAGRYYLTATLGGCQYSTYTDVQVQNSPTPILTIAPFSGTICAGVSFSVGFSVTDNDFASGNQLQAQLSDASGSFAAPTTIGSVAFTGRGNGGLTVTVPTGTAQGTGYRVRLAGNSPAVTSTNDNGANLTINARPTAAASSNSPVSYGGTIQLMAQTVAGASYQWVGPNFASTQQNPTITNASQPTNGGTYTLYVTLNGCTSSTTTTVTVNPSTDPILSVGQFGGSFCAGAAFNMGFAVTGNNFAAGNQVQAQLSDASGSFASPVVVGAASFSGQGNGTVSVTIPANTPQGAGYRLRMVGTSPAVVGINDNGSNLTINARPAAVASSNSPVAAGGTIQLTAQTVAGASYQWSGLNFSSTAQNPSISNASQALHQGTYTLTVTLNGCSNSATTQVVVGAAAATLAVGQFSGSYCPGSAVNVPFTATGSYSGGNVFTAQLSDAGGSFAAPVNIGSLTGTTSGTISGTIPGGAAIGTGYRIRVVASSPATTSTNDNGSNLAVQAVSYTWTGGYSTDWFDGRNWSCGQVPTSTSNVTIGIGTYYPTVVGTGAVANNITVVSGATFTVSSGFTLYGNVVNNGTWTGGGTYVFAGTGTQTVGGSTAVYFGGVTINSGATLSLGSTVYVAGNWVNNGAFVGGSYGVYFNGTTAQYIGGSVVTNFYNVFITNTVGLTLNQNIYLLGNWTNNGVFVANGYGATFGGSAAQVIGGTSLTNFYGLTILNTAGVTLNTGIGLGGAFVNNGLFTVNGQSVVFNGTTAQTIGGTSQTSFYHVTINNTVGVTLVSNIYVLGDWINNGQFAPGLYTVIFSGTAAQIIGGSVVTNFYDVTFQNPVSVTLHQNIYVLGAFVNTGVFYGYYLTGGVPTGYFVRFGGTAAQVITANATTYFWHFYVDNTAGITLASNIYIAGNYYLYSGSFAPGTYTVFFNGLGGYVQTVGGYTALSFYGWNIASGTEVRLLQNLTLLGSFVNAGIFYGYDLVGSVYTGYRVTFGGSAAQVLSGTGAYNFWHVTWNNAVSVTLQQNIYVLGNWLNNGGFVAGGYTVYFNGTTAQTIGGTVNTTFHHVSVGNLVSVTLAQPITVLGNWLGTGVFLADTYLVTFGGSAAQTITTGPSTRFYSVRFSNPTSVTLLSNVYLNGNWVNDGGFVAGGYGVYFVGSALQTIGGTALTSFHHITIGTGANVRLDRAVTVLGDWTTNGTFSANSFAVTFAGTANQTIGGAVIVPFYSVVINNTVSVTLAQDIRIVGGNWVNNGVFVPATYRVIFDGTLAQTIGGTAPTTFHGLTILNPTGVTLLGPIFIRGNLVNNGLLTVAGYLVTFNGTTAQTIGGTSVSIFSGVTFNNAAGVSLLNDIRVRGDFRNLALFAAGANTVYFDGTVAQGIYCPTGTLTFHHVVFSNALSVTLFNDIFVTGNWLNNGGFVAGGKLVTFNGTVLQTIGGSVISQFHHLTISPLATVRPLLNMALLGNWLNGGTFQHNSLLVSFLGTALQTIGGTTLTAFYDLTLNNAVNVSLDADIDVVHNFVNQGGFCGCGHRARFNGSTAQTITCTSGRTHFHDITFDNAAGVTLLNGINVSGLWVNNGGFVANNQLVVFDGTALQTIGGSVLTAFYNVQITNLVNVQLLRDMVVLGYWLNNGVFSGNGWLTTFSGSAQQTITTSGTGARTTFHHVTWANPVGCLLGGDVYVTGNWLCNGPFDPATYTVYFTGSTAQTCGGSATIRFFGLTVQNTAGLTCNGPVYLLGNLTNNGLINVGTYPWYCTGTAPQVCGGSTTTPLRFYDLFIQNPTGVSLTSPYGVTHLLTLPAGNLASDGHLTIHSDATGTGMVVNPVGGGLVTGRATMERFITGLAAPGYRHYSSPMQLGSATVQEFADDLPVFELNPAYNSVGNVANPFPTLFQYDETRLTASASYFDKGWMVPTATDNLLPGRGYSAQTDPTTVVDISGVLQNGAVSFNLSRGAQAGSGWNLMGNPYPAPIDWDVVRNRANGMLPANADDALYVFVPSGRYTGSYRAYVNGIGQNGGTKDIAAMQGFFVRTSAPATVSFTNQARATSYLSPSFDRPAPGAGNGSTTSGPVASKQLLRLEVRNAQAQADETVLYFEPAAGTGYQPNFDAYKVQLNGNGRPTLWSSAGPDALSINGLPDLARAGVVPLGVRVSQNGPHKLVLTTMQNLPAGTTVLLEDRLLNRRQNLALDSVYAFTMHPDSVRQRFYLWFQQRPTAATPAALQAAASLYPNPTATGRATLEIHGLREQAPIAAEVLNTVGQVVQTLTLRPQQGSISHQLNLSHLPAGVYTLRLHAAEGTIVKRLVKN